VDFSQPHGALLESEAESALPAGRELSAEAQAIVNTLIDKGYPLPAVLDEATLADEA